MWYIHIYIDVIYTYIYMIYMCIWLWYQGLFHVISPSAFVCTVSLVRCCILFRAAAAAATETRECRGLPGSMGLASASLVLWGHLVGREQFVYSVMATNASHTFPGQADWPKFNTCSVAFLSPTPSVTHPLTCTPTHALPGSSATDACAAPSKKGGCNPTVTWKKAQTIGSFAKGWRVTSARWSRVQSRGHCFLLSDRILVGWEHSESFSKFCNVKPRFRTP
jgi:hypothetical protein